MSISVAVGRGEWKMDLKMVPAYAFHAGTGLLGLWLVMGAVA